MMRGSRRTQLVAASCYTYMLLHVCRLPSPCGSFLNAGFLSPPRIGRSSWSPSWQRPPATMSSMSMPAEGEVQQQQQQQQGTRDPPRLLENLKVGKGYLG